MYLCRVTLTHLHTNKGWKLIKKYILLFVFNDDLSLSITFNNKFIFTTYFTCLHASQLLILHMHYLLLCIFMHHIFTLSLVYWSDSRFWTWHRFVTVIRWWSYYGHIMVLVISEHSVDSWLHSHRYRLNY